MFTHLAKQKKTSKNIHEKKICLTVSFFDKKIHIQTIQVVVLMAIANTQKKISRNNMKQQEKLYYTNEKLNSNRIRVGGLGV